MASRKPQAPQARQPHVHGPDCDHDNDNEHADAQTAAEPYKRAEPKQGRNDPCACGSGRKYKKCHGQQ